MELLQHVWLSCHDRLFTRFLCMQFFALFTALSVWVEAPDPAAGYLLCLPRDPPPCLIHDAWRARVLPTHAEAVPLDLPRLMGTRGPACLRWLLCADRSC